MKKFFLIGMATLSSMINNAQNNPIFYGGAGDGEDMASFIPSYTAKGYNGGVGDGEDMASFIPSYTAKSYNGGVGDGEDMASFIPNYTAKNYFGGIGDGWASSVIVLGVLPVELLSFTGHEVDNTHVLNWKTSMELNSSHFVIEHSTNAASFLELGMKDAAGNSKTEKEYQFINRTPKYGDNFYRLKMVDLDGKFKHSNVVLLKYLKNNTTIAVYPNPTAEQLNVVIHANEQNQKAQFQILDMQGKLLQQQESLVDGNTQSFNVSQYANGLYFMKINFQNHSEIVKFRIAK
ncbi:MAG: T9SS type A sorting domain-containing protein [Chitinophagaceae bacterium]|nr:T9SS type A sorting domain-containing protein [Chitinophagaceae bacterium]